MIFLEEDVAMERAVSKALRKKFDIFCDNICKDLNFIPYISFNHRKINKEDHKEVSGVEASFDDVQNVNVTELIFVFGEPCARYIVYSHEKIKEELFVLHYNQHFHDLSISCAVSLYGDNDKVVKEMLNQKGLPFVEDLVNMNFDKIIGANGTPSSLLEFATYSNPILSD